MTNKELVTKLRCISTVHTDDPGCESCPFWIKEPVPEELRDDYPDDFFSQCDCDRVNIEAADALENSETHVMALRQEIERLRGQLERQWIPVEERLPEKWQKPDGETLVNYMIYSPDFGVDIGNYHAKAQRWLCMGLPAVVTHWMPLPSTEGVE